jgi:Uri superfamily endonuclease
MLLHLQANLKWHETLLASMAIDIARAVVASHSYEASMAAVLAAVAAALVPALAADCNVVDKRLFL